jgi:hypothetical protein
MILATETVEMNVRLFILMRGANIKVFSYFEIAKKNKSDLGKIFLFQVDFEF